VLQIWLFAGSGKNPCARPGTDGEKDRGPAPPAFAEHRDGQGEENLPPLILKEGVRLGMDQNDDLLRQVRNQEGKYKSGHQHHDREIKFGGDSESCPAFLERTGHNNHNLSVPRTKATDA
jgi:hypothetical protein